MSKLLNIAIVSTNKNKYSETFIHNHVNLLPGHIHFLFEGYLPHKYSFDKGLTEQRFLDQDSTPFSAADKEKLKQQLIRHLKQIKTDVLLCEYGPSGVEMMDVAQSVGIPMVVHFFGYDAYRKDVLSTYGRQYHKLFTRSAAVICVSAQMKQQLMELGCPENKLHLRYCGVDTSLFSQASQIKKYDFVSCGRFVAKKGPKQTIMAFAEVLKRWGNANLAMIGDGELEKECRDLAVRLGISERVNFLGVLTQQEIAEVFSLSRIFLQHSIFTLEHDSEGTPLSILMAGAASLPVVSTRHGGIPEVIEHGQSGWLVAEGDVNGMSDAMFQLLMQPERAASMGRQLRIRVEKDFTLSGYMASLNSLLENVVALSNSY